MTRRISASVSANQDVEVGRGQHGARITERAGELVPNVISYTW
jgi:hypothetical protein